MNNLVIRHVMIAWIAMLGVLFSALAPTLAQAMAARPAGEEVQVCTMEGMKTIAVPRAASGKPVSIDHVFKHCPCCAAHGGTSPVLLAAPYLFVPPAVSSSYPPLFYQSATPLFSWTAAKPRGPPA